MGTATGENRAGDGEQLARHIVARPRVTQLLEAADAKVRILAAPAGYGKTTAARQWLSARQGTAAWYEATSAATDVAALATGVISATADVVPRVGTLVAERLRASRDTAPDPNLLAEAVISDLAAWPEEAWLVIDDYHLLMEAAPAERFVEHLAATSKMRLLLLTRRRPNWLTARQLIYGEVCEFGAHALAMTSDEASLVLKTTEAVAVSGLVALAQGWPAVIGLAALTANSLHNLGHRMPEALHAFFAEELYQAVPDDVREALLQLSLAPTIALPLAMKLYGRAAEKVLDDAVNFGFLMRPGEARYDLHPLLRQFLLAKTDAHPLEVEHWSE